MFTKIFPIALALAFAIGVLTELAFTKTKVFTIKEAMTDPETAVVTISGTITEIHPNTFVISDKSGSAELQTCPTWYRRIFLMKTIPTVVTGEILRDDSHHEGTLYTLAAFKITQPGRPDIELRPSLGKPPWASSANMRK